MGHRFSKIIAGNGTNCAATTITQQMSTQRQLQQQQQQQQQHQQQQQVISLAAASISSTKNSHSLVNNIKPAIARTATTTAAATATAPHINKFVEEEEDKKEEAYEGNENNYKNRIRIHSNNVDCDSDKINIVQQQQQNHQEEQQKQEQEQQQNEKKSTDEFIIPLPLSSYKNNTNNNNRSNNLTFLTTSRSISDNDDSRTGASGRQIIIKIQLAKMENGNEINIIDNDRYSNRNSCSSSSKCNSNSNSSNCSNISSCTTIHEYDNDQFNMMNTSNTMLRKDPIMEEGMGNGDGDGDGEVINNNNENNKCTTITARARATVTATTTTTRTTTMATIVTKVDSNSDDENDDDIDDVVGQISNLSIDRGNCLSTLNNNKLLNKHSCDIKDEWLVVHNNDQQDHHYHYHRDQNENNTPESTNDDSSADYCEVLTEDFLIAQSKENLPTTPTLIKDGEINVCCGGRRRAKSTLAKMLSNNEKENDGDSGTMIKVTPTAAAAAGAAIKRRCCKCSCRDAFRRILDPASSRLTNKSSKHQQKQMQQKQHQQDQQAHVNKEKSEVKHSKHHINSNSNKYNNSCRGNSSNGNIYTRHNHEYLPDVNGGVSCKCNDKNNTQTTTTQTTPPLSSRGLIVNCNEKHSTLTEATTTTISSTIGATRSSSSSSSTSSSTSVLFLHNQQRPTTLAPIEKLPSSVVPAIAGGIDTITTTATTTTATPVSPTAIKASRAALTSVAGNHLLIRATTSTTGHLDVNTNSSIGGDDDAGGTDRSGRSGRSGSGEIIIPISTPQFVVVQCAIVNADMSSGTDTVNKSTEQSSFGQQQMSKQQFSTSSTIITDVVNTSNHLSVSSPPLLLTPSNQSNNRSIELNTKSKIDKSISGGSTIASPIVHSQIDFRHFLVPDLERITNASFYWGKIDRYEAERLLDDKTEGTFLLRDSAQEEFLFSVSFRKYGRSLHARIEQSGHRFSFDCHDPGVYTASTVMGLLEHYKDPACVMFFEPMLTTPLNREFCFSLQQLSRATIVSNISYDGISELELPARMKLYLKEYHYKQKLRVKPFDELFYAPSCT